jgi:hypothetical protein
MLAKDLTVPLDREVAVYSRDPSEFKVDADPHFQAASNQSTAEELGAPASPKGDCNTSTAATLTRSDRSLGAIPTVPPSPHRNLKPLVHSPSKVESTASSKMSKSPSQKSRRGMAPVIEAVAKHSNKPVGKSALQYALKLSVWQSESSTKGRMHGEDLQHMMNVATSQAESLLEGKSTMKEIELRQQLISPVPGTDDDQSAGVRFEKTTRQEEIAKNRTSHRVRTPLPSDERPQVWPPPKVRASVSSRTRTSFEEWLRRQELQNHLESLDVGGSGRALDAVLWRLPEARRESVKDGNEDSDGKKAAPDWVRTKVHFDLQQGRLQWECDETGQDRWKHWHVSDLQQPAVEVEVKSVVKLKKRNLYSFQIQRLPQFSKRRETLVLAADTAEDRDRWVEALKRRASFTIRRPSKS